MEEGSNPQEEGKQEAGKPEKKGFFAKIGTMNIILAVVAAFFVWFNWQVLVTYRTCGGIPENYCTAVVAATIGECGICGWIKTMKERNRDRKWEKEDRAKEKKGENKE